MKFAAHLLLGSAALMVTAAGAQAADLPTRKAAPVEYVRICATHGVGFFYIPGTDTCIRIGGRARFEYASVQQYGRGDNSSFRALGRIDLDSRTTTDWGLLRAFVRVSFARDSGGWFPSGSGYRGGQRIQFAGPAGGFPNFSGQDTGGNLQEGVFIDSAFVQWGGLTAGRIQSFFDFYADNDTWFGLADSDIVTQALAYTYTFGNGFSATLSIEDPKERQLFPVAGVAPVGLGGINPNANPFVPVGGALPVGGIAFNNVFPFAFSPFAAPAVTGISYTNRESIPDIVGVLRVDQGWGSAQVSGAYHRISTVGATVLNLTPTNAGGFVVNPLVGTVPGGFGTVTGNAWAVQAGVKLNLPMIAAGDYLYLEAAYAKGALGYVNSGFPGTFTGNGWASTNWDSFASYDAVVGPSGRVRLTPAYSAMVSFEHYWTPTIRQGIFASYAHVSYGSSTRTAAGFAAGAACPTCLGTVAIAAPGGPAFYNPFSTQYDGGSFYGAGSNLIWSPVKDLDIGVEVYYARDQFQHKQFDANRGNGFLAKDADLWISRLRISRDF